MKYDVLIAGGGLNGTTLALALDQAGLTVCLADPLPVAARAAPGFDGRSYALSLASKRMLAALGLWDSLSSTCEPILEIKVTDGRPGQRPSPFVLEFDHAEIEEGPMGFMAEDRHLRRVLLDALSGSSVVHMPGQAVVSHRETPAGVTATLTDDAVEARVLVGADGMRSPTAERAGIKRMGWGYNQTSMVCAIAHSRPHHGVAHQFFLPSGPLAILPLRDYRCSIVWTARDREANAINALDDAEYLQVLRPRFGDFLGDLELAGDRYTYSLLLSVTDSFIAPRTALVGDAAHRVHPIAGQGLNAGLKDAAAFAEVVTDAARRGEDIGAMHVLQRYQSWRRFDTAALAFATDGFNRLFSNDNSLLRFGRDLGLGVVNAVPWLRRSFMREAAGLTGDLPRLLRGKAI